MKLTNEAVLQAMTDALGGLAVAMAKQVNAEQLAGDLRTLADEAAAMGHGPSAGLLDEMVRAVEKRVSRKN